jgi:hypothetical protein
MPEATGKNGLEIHLNRTQIPVYRTQHFPAGTSGLQQAVTMYRTATAALLIAGSLSLQADPAIYRDGELTIPAGAVISGQGSSYFSNITLGATSDGSFRVTGATPNQLVTVDSVEVLIMESFPVKVSVAVSGTLSVPCKSLLPAAVSLTGNVFVVVLAESNLGPAESCIAVLEPFETSIPLEVQGLPAGDYTIVVNGVGAGFTLDADNMIPG